MTIPEAIENLDQLPYQGEGCLDGKTVAALKLGIEALKGVERSRIFWGERGVPRLPGETEK